MSHFLIVTIGWRVVLMLGIEAERAIVVNGIVWWGVFSTANKL
jgi:hypothetical protein